MAKKPDKRLRENDPFRFPRPTGTVMDIPPECIEVWEVFQMQATHRAGYKLLAWKLGTHEEIKAYVKGLNAKQGTKTYDTRRIVYRRRAAKSIEGKFYVINLCPIKLESIEAVVSADVYINNPAAETTAHDCNPEDQPCL